MDSIIRGTNAYISIKIKDDIDLHNLSKVELHLRQYGQILAIPQESLTMDYDSKTVSYELTQAESLSIKSGRNLEIVLVGLNDGKRFESRPKVSVTVEDTVKNEVIA